MTTATHEIVCFGEVLWDLLPHGRFLGGAPLNVAYHLKQLGHAPRIVSALGADALGNVTWAALERAGLRTDGVATDPQLPTGTVPVTLDAAGHASYVIAAPVAWDEISLRPAAGAAPVAALVHGTLALRSATNRATLQAWIDARPTLRVCDLNLRRPYDEVTTFETFLHGVDILKLNDDEARRLVPEQAAADAAVHAEVLARRYGCRVVCITRGGDGAVLWHDGRIHRAGTPRVVVRDTIGAGDAFTAALVAGVLAAGAGTNWDHVLSRACALGAFVASRDGAQPIYTLNEVAGWSQGAG